MTAGAGEGAPAPAGRRATLGKGAMWFVGIVVVAVVGAVVPIIVNGFAPPELDVELSKVSIDENVSLDDYRIGNSPVLSFESGSRPQLRLAAYEVAQVDPSPADASDAGDGTTTGDEGTKTEDDGTTTGDDGTKTDGTRTEGDGTKTDGNGAETDGEAGPGDIDPKPDGKGPGDQPTADENGPPMRVPDLSTTDERKLQRGLDAAIAAPSSAEVTVPETCRQDLSDEDCGLQSLQGRLGVFDLTAAGSDISTDVVARHLLQVFNGTRTRRSLDDPGKRELVGVRVNFKVSMTGFRGKLAAFRWTLVSRGPASRVPRPWLRKQQLEPLEAEADRDSGSGEFWVPIPKVRGPFVVRVEAFNSGGTRLDYIDSKPFR